MKSFLAAFLFLSAVLAGHAADTHAKGAKPMHISHGEKVAIPDYLATGKTTVFDFYSEYCPPCRAFAPVLEKLHTVRSDVAVVKIDINRPGIKGIDWHSPVAKQYELQSIPLIKIYNPDGSLKAEGDEARQMVAQWANANG